MLTDDFTHTQGVGEDDAPRFTLMQFSAGGVHHAIVLLKLPFVSDKELKGLLYLLECLNEASDGQAELLFKLLKTHWCKITHCDENETAIIMGLSRNSFERVSNAWSRA